MTSPDRRSLAAWAVLAGLCLGASACVSSYVLVGKARPPIAPDSVQIYLHPPAAKYEEIALLDTSSKHSFSFTAQGKTDAVVARLKREAAKLGANGVLLGNVGDQAVGSVGTGVGSAVSSGHLSLGIGVSGSSTHYEKSGSGLAIYVEP
jgi:hypothetical protein